MPTLPFDLANALGLGREATELTFTQISLRGIIVFVAALAIVRCGDRRFLSQKTAFDAVLGFILASMLARAVNGTAAFFPTLGGGFVLVMLHRVLAYAAVALTPLAISSREEATSSSVTERSMKRWRCATCSAGTT